MTMMMMIMIMMIMFRSTKLVHSQLVNKFSVRTIAKRQCKLGDVRGRVPWTSGDYRLLRPVSATSVALSMLSSLVTALLVMHLM